MNVSTKMQRPPETWTPYGLRVAASIGWRALIVIACLYVFVQIASRTTEVTIPILVALLLTALLEPVARFLRRRAHMGPYLSAGVTILLLIAVFAGLTTLVGTQLISGFSELDNQVQAGLRSVQDWLRDGPFHIGGEQLASILEQGQSWVREHQGSLVSGVMSAGTTAVSIGAGLIIALVTTLFFLADGGHIWGWFVRLLPEDAGRPLHESMRRAWVSVAAYSRTQVLVAIVDAIGIALGALVLGLGSLVIPIGVLVVICSFVPIAGAFISGGVAVLIALVLKGPVVALIMLLIVLAVQQIEAHVMGPLLMSRAVELHPWAVIVGVALGTYVAGLVGALFTVPAMALINTAVLYLRGHDRFPELGTDDAVFHPDEPATADEGGSPADPELADKQRAAKGDPTDGPSTVTLG